MSFLIQESEPQAYDQGNRIPQHANSFHLTQSESQQMLKASISSEYPLLTLGSSGQNLFSDAYPSCPSDSITPFDLDIMGYIPLIKNSSSSPVSSTSARENNYSNDFISDSLQEQSNQFFPSQIKAMKFDFTYTSNNFLMLNQPVQQVDLEKSPTNTELLSFSEKAPQHSIQCKLCPFIHQKSSGLGGHMSKVHPGQSKKYIKKMETRRLRTQPRMTSKARSQAILSQIRKAIELHQNFL